MKSYNCLQPDVCLCPTLSSCRERLGGVGGASRKPGGSHDRFIMIITKLKPLNLVMVSRATSVELALARPSVINFTLLVFKESACTCIYS